MGGGWGVACMHTYDTYLPPSTSPVMAKGTAAAAAAAASSPPFPSRSRLFSHCSDPPAPGAIASLGRSAGLGCACCTWLQGSKE